MRAQPGARGPRGDDKSVGSVRWPLAISRPAPTIVMVVVVVVRLFAPLTAAAINRRGRGFWTAPNRFLIAGFVVRYTTIRRAKSFNFRSRVDFVSHGRRSLARVLPATPR